MSKKKRDPSAVARVCTDPETGLSTAQVQERINAGMANTPVKPPSKSVGQVIAENLFTYFNLIFWFGLFVLSGYRYSASPFSIISFTTRRTESVSFA